MADNLPPLPEPDTSIMAMSGRSVDYINGYQAGYERAADQMTAYVRAARQADEALMREVGEAVRGVDLHGMAEAVARVIEAHAHGSHPFHQPVNADALMALRVLRSMLPPLSKLKEAAAKAAQRDKEK